MVDVWSGIPVSLQAGDLTHEKIGSLVEATKDMKATKGRASYVGERSIGHIDPGSASSGLLFEALLETEAADGRYWHSYRFPFQKPGPRLV